MLGSLVLIPFNYFFAHFAFNRVLNKFAQAQVPQGQKLDFSSSFHMYPQPLIRIKDLDYKDNKGSDVSINTFDGILDVLELIKTKQLILKRFTIDGLKLSLPVKRLDELVKSIMFPIIREGLGVPRDPALFFPSKFSINNIHLVRLFENKNAEKFDITKVVYATERSDFMSMCFPSVDKAERFYKHFISQYLFAAKINGVCIRFTKSLKSLTLPTVPKQG